MSERFHHETRDTSDTTDDQDETDDSPPPTELPTPTDTPTDQPFFTENTDSNHEELTPDDHETFDHALDALAAIPTDDLTPPEYVPPTLTIPESEQLSSDEASAFGQQRHDLLTLTTPTDTTPDGHTTTDNQPEPLPDEFPPIIEEHKAPTENTPIEPNMPTDHKSPSDDPNHETDETPPIPDTIESEPYEPEFNKGKPIKDWDTLRHDLAHTPEATTLLDTYGKPAWESLEHDLNRHPYLEARDTFNQAYTYALWHRTLNAAREDNTLTDYTYKDLEDITGIPWGRIRDWELGEKTPHLERTLSIHEAARQHWEIQLPQEAKNHILDPSFVYNTLKPLLDHPDNQTTENLASAIETLYNHGSTQRVTIAELKPYHRIGPQDLRTIAHTITDHRTDLEHILNQRLNLTESQEELRIAIDHNTFYLWRKTTNPDHWPNALNGELIYLKPDIKEHLVASAQRHLNVNKQELGQLIDQLTNHPREDLRRPRATPYELYPTKYSRYLYGDTLHLFVDTTHQSFTIIKPYVTQIGRIANLEQGGGIQNPRFPEGEQLQELRARLLALALSDCHINKDGHVLTYHKSDLKRMKYGKNLFNQLGNCTYQLEHLQGRRYRLTVSAPVGRLLEHWGAPAGDKHLHPNLRLPEVIRHGKKEVKCAYIAEVIPEDGFFINRAGAQKFGIKRAQILDAGHKTDMYDFQPKITHKHKELIAKYGTAKTKTIRDDKPRDEITLTKGRLKDIIKIAETQDERNLAQQLQIIVKTNRCQLLEDEKELVESLGIGMQRLFKELKLQESERVSAIWEIYTKKATDTYRWAQLAPPSSGEKQTVVLEWVKKYLNEESNKPNKRKIRSKLSGEGVVC